MSKRLDLVGQQFGRLMVIEFARSDKNHTLWLCRCECGTEQIIRGTDLRRGHSQSCGCMWGVHAGEMLKELAHERDTAERTSLIGQVFGRYTVLEYLSGERQHSKFLCHCECGRERIVSKLWLKKGKGCPCLSREARRKASTKHGWCGTAEYKAYESAKRRCENPNTSNYADYGGRGIRFLFTSFEEFIADIGPKPSAKHWLDRIDNDGDYERGNVRWVTPSQSAQNTRQTLRKRKPAARAESALHSFFGGSIAVN